MWRAVVSQPLDRSCELPAIGPVDREGGEFWVGNAFDMPRKGFNLSAFERNRLFLNRKGNDFIDASFASQADIDSDSRSVIAADFNRDGAPDLLVGSDGGGPLRLFLNRFPSDTHRVRIDLHGATSNRLAIGTRVTAHVGERTIVRDLFPANGCMGLGPAELSIGVGSADVIDRITVRWPTGQVQEISQLSVNERITIAEEPLR